MKKTILSLALIAAALWVATTGAAAQSGTIRNDLKPPLTLGGKSLVTAATASQPIEKDQRAVTVRMPAQGYVIRQSITLAPARYFVLEFPSEDQVAIVSPQDLSLLKLDDALVKQRNPKMPLLIRAAANWKIDSEPTFLTVYMRSGALLQLDVYPTKDAFKSVDRISWHYNPPNVTRARTRLLDTETENEQSDAAAAASPSVKSEPAPVKPLTSSTTKTSASAPVVLTSVSFKNASPPSTPAAKSALPGLTIETFVVKKTDDQLKAEETAQTALLSRSNLTPPKKDKTYQNSDFQIFGKPSYWTENGLWTVSLVGIKNLTADSLQLTDVPYLQIETRGKKVTDGKKGVSVNTQPLYPLAVKSTADTSPMILAPGQTIYFSLVYRTPILGVQQTLSLSVSHTNAADAPVYFVLQPGASF